ncbi:MAG: thioredoxin family protein [Acidimicrobiales bacterium]
MDVTLLYFDDCPNWKLTDQLLQQLAGEIDDLNISHQYVGTPEDAERYQFRGSPSIQVDGVDPFANADDPVGLSCRVYQTPDGMAGSPTLDQLRTALTGG